MPKRSGDIVSSTTRLQLWLRIAPETRPSVYAQVYNSAEILSLNYWLEIFFSAAIATFGLVLNSPAVIIGAMLISPLMGPIMATGLALSAGDLYLAIKALTNLVASAAVSIGISGFLVWLLPFHSATSEILARTNPNLLDLGVALFSGLAGSVVVCRGGGGTGVTALPGVAIAVALMPPLCAMGFGLGSGPDTRIMGGAGLLFLTNLVAIVASAFSVFLLVGMNSDEVRSEMKRSQMDDSLAQRLSRGPLARALSKGGQLHWRILMLVAVLGFIAVPLRTALMQVAGEVVARGVVREVLKGLVPPSASVSQQVQVGRESLAIRVISTQSVADSKVEAAQREIERRTGRKVDLSIEEVASKSELAQLMERLSASPVVRPSPPVKSLDEMHQDVRERIGPIISAVWPAEAPLQDFDLAFGNAGIALNVRYQAARELGPIPLGMILRELRDKLSVRELTLDAKRVPVRRAEPKKSETKQR